MPKRDAKGVSSGVGLPHRMEGRDGDITIRRTRDGKVVYIKEHGSWHQINTGIDVSKLKKDVDRLSRLSDNFIKENGNNVKANQIVINKKPAASGSGILLKNDAGVLKFRNSADDADAVVKAKTLKLPSVSPTPEIGDFYYDSSGGGHIVHGVGLAINSFSTATGDDQSAALAVISKGDGDSVVKFLTGGSNRWSLGNDGSDSNKFKIHNGVSLVDDSLLDLDTSGNMSIDGTMTAGGFTTTGTWTFDEYTSGTIGITSVQDSGTTFNDNDTSLMTAAAIADKIEAYGYSTASGDITGVTITTDSGGGSAASDTGGSADFSILGANGVGVTNSGATITVAAVPGEIDHDSLNNFVANEHIDWTGASAGTIHASNYSAGASALNDLSDVTYSSGDLTISSLDKIIASDFVVDSGASVELDSHNGNFVAKKAGTEFSIANAGMILGYRMIGETHAHTSYTLTTSMAVPDSDMTVRFIAPPSGIVEYEVQIYADVYTNYRLYFGLSDNATYNSVGNTYEQQVLLPDETDISTVTWKVVETGLTAGTTYNRWFGARVSSVSATSKLFFGGTSINRYVDFIMKVTALPAAVSDFAVYE